MCLATLPQTSTNMSDASMPNASQRVQGDADVDEQIRHIIADLPKINAKLENAPPADIIRWSIDNLPHLYQITRYDTGRTLRIRCVNTIQFSLTNLLLG